MWKKFLKYLLLISLYVLVFLCIFTLQELIMELISWIWFQTIFNRFYVHDIIFLTIAFMIVLKYVKINIIIE